jgi:hypothetical protein
MLVPGEGREGRFAELWPDYARQTAAKKGPDRDGQLRRARPCYY